MAATTERPFPSSSLASGGDANRPAADPDTPPDAGSPGSTFPTDHFTRTTRDDDMLGRVVQGAHQTIDRLAETAAPHVKRLQDGVGARAEHAKEVGDEWAESLRCTVRDNPLAAVATAVALGVLIARLTQR
jgi:ElaB/YqjD/DUF883 family membrane-anchored ribosome-binding protein